MLTSEEILSFLERKEVGRGMLGRGAMLSSIIRLADRDGEGTVRYAPCVIPRYGCMRECTHCPNRSSDGVSNVCFIYPSLCCL